MKKILLSFLVLFFILVSCNSASPNPNPYSNCNKKTKAQLEKIDELIKEQKYETAFTTCQATNEYLLAKKVEIATQYFAISVMHRMFGFKDLEPGETLESVRMSQSQNINAELFNPVELIEEYTKKHGEKPILHYALGLYYNDVFMRYGDQWGISEKQLEDNAIEYLQKAVDENCYDAVSLGALSDACMYSGKFEECIKALELKSTLCELSIDNIYTLGYAYGLLKEYDKAIPYMEKAIAGYSKGTQYLYDAYVVLSGIYCEKQDYKSAEKILKEAQKEFPEAYQFRILSVSVYAYLSDKNECLKSARAFFDMYPENPSSLQMILSEIFTAQKKDWLVEFFDSTIESYKGNAAALENLYFHYALYYSEVGDKENASKWAKTAKKQFKDNGTLTDDVSSILNGFIIP